MDLAILSRADTWQSLSIATFYRILSVALVVVSLLSPLPAVAQPHSATQPGARGSAREAAANPARCVAVELFVSKGAPYSIQAQADLERRPGLHLRVFDVTTNEEALRRFYDLADRHKVAPRLPLLSAAQKVVIGYDKGTSTRFDEVLTVEVFAREGCAHCAAAKPFLKSIEPRYPGMRFRICDVVADPGCRARFEQLSREHGVRVPGVPGFRIGREFLVGYTGDATTGVSLIRILDSVTVPCEGQFQPVVQPLPPTPSNPPATPPARVRSSQVNRIGLDFGGLGASQASAAEPVDEENSSPSPPPTDEVDASSEPPPRPGGAREPSQPETPETPPPTGESMFEVDVPVFGRLDSRRIGMPLFTILIGLVDGFNPCAMWVLLFLLSILVSLHDRRKILAVAGTFVVVSGLVYFAFMAAWLNVFRLIGLRRWSEVALALIAVVIGLINVKDFFAFHRGVTLSIPESAKPGIYARARAIATARSLTGAIAGAVVLAVLINFVELLCTAGLPALYTKVLTMRQYPAWLEMGYLGLYILAYMFDDGLMVGIAVATLGRYKLQERGGRWLKLVSGLAILVLGLMLLFAPQWLL